MAKKSKKFKKAKKAKTGMSAAFACAPQNDAQDVAVENDIPFNPDAFNNGDTPTIIVRACSQYPDRGDTHGPLGLAGRLVEKYGGKIDVLDEHALEQMYPKTQSYLRIKEHFNLHGYPDFIFGHVDNLALDMVSKRKRTVIVSTVNEYIPGYLGIKREFNQLCPHHLTPQELEYQGLRFAEEYSELPRPFFGIIMASPYSDVEKTASRLAGQHWFSREGTFFVVSCHRTGGDTYNKFVEKLKNAIPERKRKNFPVIEFNYKKMMEYHGRDGVWNPYKGLVSQADHLVLMGTSESMLSEMLMSGRRVYTSGMDVDEIALKKGYLKSLFTRFSFLPLRSPPIRPPDLTAACANALIVKYKSMKAPGCSSV